MDNQSAKRVNIVSVKLIRETSVLYKNRTIHLRMPPISLNLS